MKEPAQGSGTREKSQIRRITSCHGADGLCDHPDVGNSDYVAGIVLSTRVKRGIASGHLTFDAEGLVAVATCRWYGREEDAKT